MLEVGKENHLREGLFMRIGVGDDLGTTCSYLIEKSGYRWLYMIVDGAVWL